MSGTDHKDDWIRGARYAASRKGGRRRRAAAALILALVLTVAGCAEYTIPTETSATTSVGTGTTRITPTPSSTTTRSDATPSPSVTHTGPSGTSATGTTTGTTEPSSTTQTGTTARPTTSGTTTTGRITTTRPGTTTTTTRRAATPTPTTRAPTSTPTPVPATATPAPPPPSSFPYVSYGTLFNNTYSNASATLTSSDGRAKLSMDQAANGVILVRLDNSSTTCKVAVTVAGKTHQYPIQPGQWYGVPANGGSGSYSVMILEQISGSSYLPLLNESVQVSLSGSLKPYLAASVLVNYGSGSQAVQKAAALTGGIGTTDGKVSAVYQWIVSNIRYDSALASGITSGTVTSYVPNIDATLQSGKGICYDYAALMAGMLRSQGIPTRLVKGNVPQGYHAWNEVYFKGTGWVIVADFQVRYVDGAAYVMFDSTFGAGGMTIPQINSVSRTVTGIY